MTMTDNALVIGASGFLGSHVCKQLVAQGRQVRVMLRPSSGTRALEGLPFEICYGDVHDQPAMTEAMTGCSSVFYGVMDTRAWLRDPAPLYRTNVEGLRNPLAMACSWRNYPLDNRKAREELGWEPRPLEDSIRAAVAFYKAQYRLSRG